MRILFDMGVYDLRNKGNVALLQVAVNRLRGMWPGASIEVLTDAPHLLRLYIQNAIPVSPDGSYNWSTPQKPINRSLRSIPRSFLRLLFEIREAIWHSEFAHLFGRAPQNVQHLQLQRSDNEYTDLQFNIFESGGEKSQTYVEPIKGADLFVATGGQYLSDVIRNNTLQVFDRLEAAYHFGVPTVMVGQGIGPIEDPGLRSRAKTVLPLVNFIFIRERLAAPALLESFGVDPARVIVTGDDAIELAYEARKNYIGFSIGVGMRKTYYTEVENHHLQDIREVLHDAASRRHARLISLPISHSAHELDSRVISHLLENYRDALKERFRFDTPVKIIKRTGHCRLVVSGTFHTAVFALGQGIPAIGLAKSDLYVNKFSGLADQFGDGFELIRLDDERLRDKLSDAIDRAWLSAEVLRPRLLESAVRQNECGRAAYQRIYQLVESANNKPVLEVRRQGNE